MDNEIGYTERLATVLTDGINNAIRVDVGTGDVRRLRIMMSKMLSVAAHVEGMSEEDVDKAVSGMTPITHILTVTAQ